MGHISLANRYGLGTGRVVLGCLGIVVLEVIVVVTDWHEKCNIFGNKTRLRSYDIIFVYPHRSRTYKNTEGERFRGLRQKKKGVEGSRV